MAATIGFTPISIVPLSLWGSFLANFPEPEAFGDGPSIRQRENCFLPKPVIGLS